MADIKDFKHAIVRQKILEAVKKDLIGPSSECEELNEVPTSSYITGLLYPADTAVTEDENYFDVEFTEKKFDADWEVMEAGIFVDEEPEDRIKSGFQKSSSVGVSFYVDDDVSKINAYINWGKYHAEQIQSEVVDGTLEEDTENKKKKKHTVYVREQMHDVVEIDLNNGKRSEQIILASNSNIYIYAMKMQLNNGYKMVSVYLHNNDKSDGEEKEYEKVMFQVEMLIADDLMSPIFIPEYVCRKVELEDEYYYKGRPVYARGRGCAVSWSMAVDEVNATSVRTAFIPDYEIPSVSAQIEDMPEHAFSMLQMGSPKKKTEVIENLRLLTSIYGDWIEEVLENDTSMKDDKFRATGQAIIEKCNDANRRMNVGIDLIENNEKAYQAFVFMNQAMYLQRSITSFSKYYGSGISCSLRDFMSDMPEKGRKQDHSEWRPFQIAFVLLNLYGIMDGESLEREIVDLLYFPTGGGKTEAYLGLIAFTIAYRRLTAKEENEYEKDGGVTVFLRYTLRLLTTQQRDRLTRLIVAMEQLREKNTELYGNERITIGFWVGGNVTPNKFSDYCDTDQFKKKDFLRKLTKQIIKCPYCGKPIERDDYIINEKGKSVQIHCSDDYCMFSKKTGRTIPVYLVDEEIYAKCPTVIISTVDKFARLPWTEQVGLLFGKTGRCCSRCGHIAIGEKHPGRHNADTAAGLDKAVTTDCKPFYPPELIIQDELHLITGPLGTIYGGYETVVEEMCCIEKNGKKIRPKYVVSTATIKNAGEQIKFLYGRDNFAQFPPSGFDTRDSFFIREVPLPRENLASLSEERLQELIDDGQKPFRQYVGICASGQSVKTTLIRLYSIILQTALDLAKEPEFEDYIDPYYTLIGYFNSIRELGGAVRLLDDDITSRIRVVKNKYNSLAQRYIGIDGKKEITSRIPSWEIARVLEKLAISYDKKKERQSCYDVVIATNMIAVGMDVDRLGLMTVVGQPKQNSEYIQATSRVGRQHPGIIFTIYNPYRPRDLSNYENFVGFHSQMYRYVEGTTATPFAARARDRVLHALIVSLLRLKFEEMADNGGATNINKISDNDIKRVKEMILERVKVTAPSSYVDTGKEIDEFISIWKNIAKIDKLYYFVPYVTDDKKRLLTYYGEFYGDKEKPTLSSMRDVEQSSTVFYWEGV
ncbi:MAG: DISARM system helicase DrmA [Clostridium sp.]|nr:DISARM system helicase DrmA [Clostridium sp.]